MARLDLSQSLRCRPSLMWSGVVAVLLGALLLAPDCSTPPSPRPHGGVVSRRGAGSTVHQFGCLSITLPERWVPRKSFAGGLSDPEAWKFVAGDTKAEITVVSHYCDHPDEWVHRRAEDYGSRRHYVMRHVAVGGRRAVLLRSVARDALATRAGTSDPPPGYCEEVVLVGWSHWAIRLQCLFALADVTTQAEWQTGLQSVVLH